MKTNELLIIDNENYNALSEECRKEIYQVIDHQVKNLADLKEIIEKLEIKYLAYRSDKNIITYTDSEPSESGLIDWYIYEKTCGDEWGNQAGTQFSLHVGRKYISLRYYDHVTNRPDSDDTVVRISLSAAMNIINIFRALSTCDPEDSNLIAKKIEDHCDKYFEHMYQY